MEPIMKILSCCIVILSVIGMITTFQIVQLRGQVISLQTDNATQAQRITELEKQFDNYPFDHSRIESNVNLIGGAVFPNWDKASELWAKRGK
jgi:hypothetical protein